METILLGGVKNDAVTTGAAGRLKERLSGLGEVITLEENTPLLACYANDASGEAPVLPLAIFRPSNTDTIGSAIMAIAEEGYSITPRCGGTGLSGGAVPPSRGVVILMNHLRTITDYDPIHGVAVAEAGVTARQLQQHIEKDGWTVPADFDTAGIAGFGGTVASGLRPYRQGKGPFLTDCITAVEGVKGDGDAVEFPAACWIGSEGVLGIITRVHLQLIRKAADKKVFSCTGSLSALTSIQQKLLRSEAAVSVEWYDGDKGKGIVRFEGDEISVGRAEKVLLQDLSMSELSMEPLPLIAHRPSGCHHLLFSSVVPLSKIEDGIEALKAMVEELQFGSRLMAQVLDARIVAVVWKEGLEAAAFRQNADALLEGWANYLVLSGGAITASHGVGTLFSRFLPPFHSEGDFAAMDRIQRSHDFRGVLKGNKLFSEMSRSLERDLR